MRRVFKIVLITILVGVLAIIRVFFADIFYDPLTLFYKHDYLFSYLPDFDLMKLIINIFFRYLLNSIVSLAIIYLVFLKRDIVVFSVWVFIVGFFVFIIPFYFFLLNYEQENYLLLFYIRRFLIQPILLLLLLPAFYYQKLTDS